MKNTTPGPLSPTLPKKFWIILWTSLLLSLLADWFVPHGTDASISTRFGFSAWFGFLSCVVLVILAKILGIVLKRFDTYYHDTKPHD